MHKPQEPWFYLSCMSFHVESTSLLLLMYCGTFSYVRFSLKQKDIIYSVIPPFSFFSFRLLRTVFPLVPSLVCSSSFPPPPRVLPSLFHCFSCFGRHLFLTVCVLGVLLSILFFLVLLSFSRRTLDHSFSLFLKFIT